MEDERKVKPNSSWKTPAPCNIDTNKNKNAIATTAMLTHRNAAIGVDRTIITGTDKDIVTTIMAITMMTTIDRAHAFAPSRTEGDTTMATTVMAERMEVSIDFPQSVNAVVFVS